LAYAIVLNANFTGTAGIFSDAVRLSLFYISDMNKHGGAMRLQDEIPSH